VAIRGADPVAFFREGRPVTGDAAFEADWNGARWRFASASNRDDFLAAPERFAPNYGGFCAWAVAARGKLYSTQPPNWSIVDDRLYLNFNDDIQRRWEADIPGFIAEADRRWPEIVAGVSSSAARQKAGRPLPRPNISLRATAARATPSSVRTRDFDFPTGSSISPFS
jgi:YHS domain-containing protein